MVILKINTKKLKNKIKKNNYNQLQKEQTREKSPKHPKLKVFLLTFFSKKVSGVWGKAPVGFGVTPQCVSTKGEKNV